MSILYYMYMKRGAGLTPFLSFGSSVVHYGKISFPAGNVKENSNFKLSTFTLRYFTHMRGLLTENSVVHQKGEQLLVSRYTILYISMYIILIYFDL